MIFNRCFFFRSRLWDSFPKDHSQKVQVQRFTFKLKVNAFLMSSFFYVCQPYADVEFAQPTWISHHPHDPSLDFLAHSSNHVTSVENGHLKSLETLFGQRTTIEWWEEKSTHLKKKRKVSFFEKRNWKSRTKRRKYYISGGFTLEGLASQGRSWPSLRDLQSIKTS